MKKSYLAPRPSSKSVRKVSFSCFSLFGLICHYSPNSPKNLLFVLIALLFISSCKKDPVEQKVTSITLAPPSPRVVVGGKQQLEITVLPADAANKEVTWSSNDENKATVDETGLVTGAGEGTAIITAAAKDGSNVKGTVTITITPIKVTSIVITPSSPRVAVGDKRQLKADILPADATNKELTWSSSDESKATVDAAGSVTGAGEGTAIITAAAKDGSNVKGTVTITVTKIRAKATSVAVAPSSPNVAVGLTQQLTATIAPADASQEVTWSSSNESKATVDATGLVTGIGMGTAVITAAAKDGSDVKGTVTVNITVRATSVAITPADPSVGIRGNLTLTAAVLPAEAAQAVRWASSDPTKATIDAATGVATGIALGTTVITATAADGSGVAGTVTLTVSDVTIALGAERFNVALPAAGGAVTLANAPRSIASDIRAVKVYITAAANAAIKMGSAAFTQGQPVDFTNPATFTITAQDGTAKSYTISIPSYNATGNPYGIYTVKHLVDVANGLTASYLLKNNIDLPNKDAAAATGISNYASEGWRPLGDANSYFTGTFDGGNFSINNFYIKNNPGLFRGLGEGGIIKNLGVNATSGTVVEGGILASNNSGTIDKCYATGSVSYSSSSYSSVGGLVGINSGSISNSYATGNVSSSYSSVGGLVGSNSGSITNSYATVNISSDSYSSVGGLVGINSGRISNSYATGSVSSSSSSTSSIGGLVGSNNNSGNGSISISISNSYAMGSVSYSSTTTTSSSSVGGLVGSNINNNSNGGSISISNSYATGSVSSSSSSYSSVGGLVGSNSSSNSISNSISISDSYATGSVSSSSSSYDYSYVGGLVGNNNSSISNSYATGSVSSTSTSTSYSTTSVGGLVGGNSGRISNSYATGSVSSTATTTSYSSSSVGGLVGSNIGSGSISNSYATGSVSSTSTSSTTSVGGLVGSNIGSGRISISNSYATGNVSSSATDVSAKVGGLVGRSERGTYTEYTNCYRNSNAVIKKGNAEVTPDDASIEGITPKTKTDMQTDAFKGNLNVSGTVWGRSDAKNDKLPFIIGVGVGAGG